MKTGLRIRQSLLVAGWLCFWSQGARTQTAISYDPESSSYLLSSNASESSAVLGEDGKLHQLSSAFFPLPLRSAFGGNSLSPVKTPWGAGWLLNGEELVRFDKQGHIQRRRLLAEGLIPCEKVNANDTCQILRLQHTGSQYLAGFFHSTLGLLFYAWDGARFVPLQKPLSLLDLGDLFTLDEEVSLSTPGFDKVLSLRIYNELASRDRLQVLYADHVERLDVPQGFAFSKIQSFRTFGKQAIIALGNRQRQGVLALDLEESVLALKEREDAKSFLADQRQVLGVDAQGWLYAFRSRDRSLAALQLTGGEQRELGACEGTFAAVPLRSSTDRPDASVWVSCGNSVLRLQGAKRFEVVRAALPIRSALISSRDEEPFAALLTLDQQRLVLFRQGQAVGTEQYAPILNQAAQVSTLAWEDGLQLCQMAAKSPEKSQEKAIFCLRGSEWRLQTSYPLPPPRDVLESETMTWYLSEQGHQYSLWRRERTAGGRWIQSFEWTQSEGTQKLQLFPTAKKDQIGLKGHEGGALKEDATGASSFLLNVKAQDFVGRPTLAADAWVYGLVRTSDNPQALQLISIDPSGQTHVLHTFPEGKWNETQAVLFPLQRGVLFAPDRDVFLPGDNQAESWYVGYHERSVPLEQLYGELKGTSQRYVKLQAWGLGKGEVILQKSQLSSDSAVQDRQLSLYRFDGRTLNFLKTKTDLSNAAFAVGSRGSGPALYGPQRYPQIWQTGDGLWQRPMTDEGSLPLLTRSETLDLFTDATLDPNTVTAAARWQNQLVLATAQGLWFCPEGSGMKVQADTQWIDRQRGCRLQPLALTVQKIFALGTQDLYLGVGQSLYRYQVSEQVIRPIHKHLNIAALSMDEDRAYVIEGDALQSFALSDPQHLERVYPLPSGVDSTSVKALSGEAICSSKGLFVWTEVQQGWDQKAKACRTGVYQGGQLWVLADEKIRVCASGQCETMASYRSDPRQTPVLGYQDGLLVGSGRQLMRLEGSQLKPCSGSWGLGTLPLGDVEGLEQGIVRMKKAGAMQGLCDQAPELFRLF